MRWAWILVCCEAMQSTDVALHVLFDAVLKCALVQGEALPVHLGGRVWSGYRQRR